MTDTEQRCSSPSYAADSIALKWIILAVWTGLMFLLFVLLPVVILYG